MTDKPTYQSGEPEEPLNDAESAEQPRTGEQAEPVEDAALGDPKVALQAERDELYERLQRVSADYQNYIRRSAQSLADSVELAKGDLAKQLITLLDHFDNALAKEPKDEEARALYDGVKIVRDELLRVLKNAGVEPLGVRVGDPFDPELHEAMMRQPVEGVDPNHVSMVMQTGYQHGSRTLRPAKVAVAPAE